MRRAILAGAVLLAARTAFAGSVPLTVDEPAGVPRKNFHVRGGVPFPKGALKDPSDVKLSGPSGPVPCSAQSWVKWPDGSVMWLLLDFGADLQANQKATYTLEYGAGGGSAKPSPALSVEDGGSEIAVDTGPLKFTVSKAKATGLSSATLGGQKVLEGTTLVVQANGQTLEGSGTTAVVEEKSPVHCVIRCEGTHGGKYPYVLRIHALAGSPTLKVEHTWISDQDGETAEVTSIEMREKLALGGDKEFAVGPGLNRKDQWGGYSVDPAAPEASGKASGPVQVTQTNWNAFATTGAAQRGKHHRGWIGLSDLKGGLAIGVREFHQLYRKGVKADPASDTVTAYLWAGPDSVPLKRHSKILNEHSKKSRGKPDPAGEESIGNSKGVARTHDVILHFYKGGAKQEGVDAVVAAWDRPSILFPGAKWVCDSRTFGALHPLTPGKFDSTEGWFDRILCWWIWNQHNDPHGQKNRGPWYGFIDYGDWQIAFLDDWQYTNGRYSWDDNEPDIAHSIWQQYARTGDRLYYDAAEAFSRHTMDVDCAHFPKSDPLYAEYNGAGRRHCVSHWGEDAAYYGLSHTWTRGWLEYYKFAGYRRSLDVAREGAEYGWHVIITGRREWPNGNKEPQLWDREFCAPMLNQVCLWEATGEAVYKERSDDTIHNAYLKYQHPDGAWPAKFSWGQGKKVVETSKSSFKSSPGGFSVYYANPAFILYHELTGDEAVAKGIVKNADFLFKRPDHEFYALETWAFAYQQTKDAKYLNAGKAAISKYYKSAGKVSRGTYTQAQLYAQVSPQLKETGISGLRTFGRWICTAPFMLKCMDGAGP